jgi:hypothetical protein
MPSILQVAILHALRAAAPIRYFAGSAVNGAMLCSIGLYQNTALLS